jgi:hypothetical protein
MRMVDQLPGTVREFENPSSIAQVRRIFAGEYRVGSAPEVAGGDRPRCGRYDRHLLGRLQRPTGGCAPAARAEGDDHALLGEGDRKGAGGGAGRAHKSAREGILAKL